MSSTAMANHMLDRIRADVHFLHSQSLLDNEGRDAIMSRLDAASTRNNAGAGNSVVALSHQLGAASVNSHTPPAPAPPARDHFASQQDSSEKARALWSYAATQPDDLSFQKGDIIVITLKENDHWFRGFVQTDPSRRAGLFPSNHVETLASDNQSTYSSRPTASPYDKAALQPYQHPAPPAPQQYYGQQPPQPYYQQPPPQHYPQQQMMAPAEPQRKNKFSTPGTFKNTLATSAVAGGAFGGASALVGNVVNAIL